MTKRDLIIVDTETTGLDPAFHLVIEIAAIHTRTGERLYLAPRITDGGWRSVSPKAMTINRYFERRVFERWVPGVEEEQILRRLKGWLDGNTIGGANPAFDLDMLNQLFDSRRILRPTPHHRKADISNLTASHFGIAPTELPGLRECCELLGVSQFDAHTAAGDVEATWQCFQALAFRQEALA